MAIIDKETLTLELSEYFVEVYSIVDDTNDIPRLSLFCNYQIFLQCGSERNIKSVIRERLGVKTLKDYHIISRYQGTKKYQIKTNALVKNSEIVEE